MQWQIKEPSAVFWGLVSTVTDFSQKLPTVKDVCGPETLKSPSALFRNLKSEGSDHLALGSLEIRRESLQLGRGLP